MKCTLTFSITFISIQLLFSLCASDLTPLDGRGGGVIAYSVTYANNTNKIFLVNADGSGNSQLSDQGGRPLGPAWAPNAARIAFYNHFSDRSWSLFLMNADGSEPRRLTSEPDALDWSLSWFPDGQRLLFTRSRLIPTWRSEIWTIKSDGSDARRIGNMDGQGADCSPDGKKIVYFNYVDGGGDIWVMDPDGSNSQRITDHGAEDWWPNWSPDGGQIVFQSKRDGNFEIYTMKTDGSELKRLTNNDADDEEPRWSPDGGMIAFSSMRDGHYEIYVMKTNGSAQKRVTWVDGQAINPDWKPATK